MCFLEPAVVLNNLYINPVQGGHHFYCRGLLSFKFTPTLHVSVFSLFTTCIQFIGTLGIALNLENCAELLT